MATKRHPYLGAVIAAGAVLKLGLTVLLLTHLQRRKEEKK